MSETTAEFKIEGWGSYYCADTHNCMMLYTRVVTATYPVLPAVTANLHTFSSRTLHVNRKRACPSAYVCICIRLLHEIKGSKMLKKAKSSDQASSKI